VESLQRTTIVSLGSDKIVAGVRTQSSLPTSVVNVDSQKGRRAFFWRQTEKTNKSESNRRKKDAIYEGTKKRRQLKEECIICSNDKENKQRNTNGNCRHVVVVLILVEIDAVERL
jgi:hypothetical protein